MQDVRIVGYTDRLSVQRGQQLDLKVSSEAARYAVDVVRLRHGDTSPSGPGPRSEVVAAGVGGTLAGRRQPLRTGSYAEVEGAAGLFTGEAFTVAAWVHPTLPGRGPQGLVTRFDENGHGGGIVIDADGHAVLVVAGADGRTARLRSRSPLRPRVWQFVAATFDARTGRASVTVQAAGRWVSGAGPEREEATLDAAAPADSRAPLVIAAAITSDHDGTYAGSPFDGKLEAPAVWGRALDAAELARAQDQGAATVPGGLLGAWDFADGIGSRRVHDAGPDARHGRTVNLPARGVTGRRWTGTEVDWRRAPGEYAAIHFHSDDLDDARWDTDLRWTVPEDLPSGVYAFRLRAGDAEGGEDHVPFFVRPRTGTATARIAVLLPTYTYLAYANEQQLGRDEIRSVFEGLGADFTYPLQPADQYVVDHSLLSLYDRHRDGSGVFHSSRLRPILSMRPDYRFPYLMQGRGAPHGLGADLHLIDWLRHAGYEFDVLTDEDLHAEGAGVLRPYRAVISGSHHEYWTQPMLTALDEYLEGGGRFMYLSGNGLYWVTGVEPDEGHTIEIRRCGASSRTWEAAPGEWHLSSTGELGGLWRFRDQAPQVRVGVGFSAEGLGRGRPYARTGGSHDPRAAFIFAGVGDDELIGDFENLVLEHGAAGWEIDRHDRELGSPPHSLVVATASGFSDEYQHVVDEVLHADSRQGGTVDPHVRSDVVFFECPNGGAVFSAGSIGWCGSLSFNGYENTVARVTGNVLARFVSHEPFELPRRD